jgi:uncharacterized Fe-S cluster-containing radical SAM superfamily protein
MKKIKWPFEAGAFYITDVCNFTCSECVSYNNLSLKGYSKWEENKKYIEGFSHHIEFSWIEIMGGEPFLNPDLENWLKGMREYNPNSLITLCTNGSRVLKVKNLYELLKDYNIILDVSWHGYGWDNIKNNVLSILKNPKFLEHKNVRDVWVDDNSVKVFFNLRNQFTKSSNFLANKFYDSDPEKAYSVCEQRICPDIREGKVYKCPVIPSILKVNEQLPELNLNSNEISFLKEYQPMSWDWSYDEKKKWLEEQDRAIPQCRLCPTKIDFVDYECQDKKKIIPIKTI